MNQSIQKYSTFKIGGNTRCAIITDSVNQMECVIPFLIEREIPFVIVGGGSNLIFSDNLSNLVVVVNRTSQISILNGNHISIDSGVPNKKLLNWMIKNNASGLEFLAGIPGSIGGAVALNAGAFGESIADYVVSAVIINENGLKQEVDKDFFQFSYRYSILHKRKIVILSLVIRLREEQRHTIKQRIHANMIYRQTHHPNCKKASVGCFFKNPKTLSAGKLIELAGLRGYRYKNLLISYEHANFILNIGQSSFQDVCELETIAQDKVFKNHGIHLQREVIFVSENGNYI
jgi:UDP-N-acetylmuramate dehydrogenase